eukprot:gnl/MRDRNA2_/MRDRNA2_102929_c0_seq1.p1 gnl/MRDRNA2_/MRDRNA2_102929_c0~~gnl/MRDRNA2_/MRDRNA2_102929_c0_seq1.p1  ORF type:complete len:306 (-),score=72.52 gnl/MRDRNA2_/MRDRNA2_102929_c0_seq1:19-936(-)
MQSAFAILVSASLVCVANAFLKPANSSGPASELKIAAVEICNATSTIRTAAGLAPVGGRDQGSAEVLLELEQQTEDLAEQAHAIWVNATANQRQIQLRRRSSRASTMKGIPAASADPAGHAVAVLERSGSIVVQNSKEGANRGNLTMGNEDAQISNGNFTLEKPGSKKGRSIPGLRAAMGTVLQALQHVQSAARAQRLGNGGEDVVSGAQLVMDRARELYSTVEVATARVAGGTDAQTRVEERLTKIQSRIMTQSADLGNDPLAMTRELRLVKHVVREAVGGNVRHNKAARAYAKEALKEDTSTQ